MYAEQTMPEGEIYAQNQRGGIGRIGSAPTLTPSLVASAIKDLSELLSQARHANGSLIETRQRLFGAGPENGSTASQLRCATAGQAGDLNDVICELRSALYEVRDNAASLSSAI